MSEICVKIFLDQSVTLSRICVKYFVSHTPDKIIVSITFFEFSLTLGCRSARESVDIVKKHFHGIFLQFYMISMGFKPANSMCTMMMVSRMVKQDWVQLAKRLEKCRAWHKWKKTKFPVKIMKRNTEEKQKKI